MTRKRNNSCTTMAQTGNRSGVWDLSSHTVNGKRDPIYLMESVWNHFIYSMEYGINSYISIENLFIYSMQSLPRTSPSSCSSARASRCARSRASSRLGTALVRLIFAELGLIMITILYAYNDTVYIYIYIYIYVYIILSQIFIK